MDTPLDIRALNHVLYGSPAAYDATRRTPMLLAEDDDGLREVVAEYLSAIGFEVTCVSNGDELLRELSRENAGWKLVLADVHMPGMSSIEVLERVPQLVHSIPVLLVTGTDRELASAQAFQVGALGVLAKPFALDDLASMVMHLA